MSELKYCQSPYCHTYMTQDRLKGTKGSKTYQTRRRSSLNYGEFCDTRCERAWLIKYATKAIDHFGRLKEVKHLTEENAWHKTYDWDSRYQNRIYVYLNYITKERRPITEEQFNTDSYTLNVS